MSYLRTGSSLGGYEEPANNNEAVDDDWWAYYIKAFNSLAPTFLPTSYLRTYRDMATWYCDGSDINLSESKVDVSRRSVGIMLW